MKERDKFVNGWILGIFGLLAVVMITISLTSCDKKSILEKAGDVLGDVAVNSLMDTYRDGELVEAYAQGGWSAVKQDAPRIYYIHLKNNLTKLAEGSELEREVYKFIQDNDETLARVIYRDDGLGPVGAWPRIDKEVKSLGYPGASLSLILTMAEEHKVQMWEFSKTVFIEEFAAVMAKEEISRSQGLDIEGEWYEN